MNEEMENEIINSPDFSQEIVSVIENEKVEKLSELLEDYHDYDLAKVLPLLSEKQRKKLYFALSDEYLSDIFSYLDNPSEFIEEMSGEKAADIIEEMDSDDAADILEELGKDKQKEIFDLLDDESKRDINLINAYDEDYVGSAMTNDFVCVSNDMTIKQVMRKVIKDAGENDNISIILVTDEKGVYKGAIRLRDLVIARGQTPLEDIIITAFPYLFANSLITDNLQTLKEYAEPTLPVLDDDNRLIGALTSADFIEAMDDEFTEDYAKLAGLSEDALDDSSNKKSFLSGLLNRLPWLAILLVLDLFIGAYVGVFEAAIIGLPFLVSFQQLVSGMSGNAGTQTLALTVQMLADSDVTHKEKIKFFFKEIKVGLLIGLITGCISLVAIGAYSYLSGAVETLSLAISVGASVGTAMFLSASIATLTGSLIPITLNKLGVDPAVASGPLITTFNDLIAITVYYGIALLLIL